MRAPRRAPTSPAPAAIRLAVGAALAAALGSSAGAALRPAPAERGAAAAPQQIFLNDLELTAAERRSGGWPGRMRFS